VKNDHLFLHSTAGQDSDTRGAATARRDFLRQALGLIAGAYAQAHVTTAVAQSLKLDTAGPLARKALVLGNTVYRPERQAIPSSRKNALDVGSALADLGFDVRREVDQGTDSMRALIRNFFGELRASSQRSLAVFYYTGHGIQHRGENYMVGSDVGLDQKTDAIARSAINIDQDVIAQASLPNDGTCVLIFDACRNDPTRVSTDAAATFNQVNPPRGTVITFSTAPGRYAIAPLSPDENSIYTGILVRELKKANADLSVKDFLDHVKFEVRRFMEKHEEAFLRKHAQDPEVAANLTLRMSLALEKTPVAVADDEQVAWARIEQIVVPAERVKLLQDFLSNHPGSRFRQAAEVQLQRAVLSQAATQRNRVQIEKDIGNDEFRADQAKALDGDKDAAYRVGQMFELGSNGVPRDERKMVQWLRHASELKNGIASYQLYLYYRDRQIDRDAVRYENLARDQGYTPPPRLDTRRG
jgi:hypothetical protein